MNRVLGSDATSIYGTLTANGIFLINPNGILFSPTAQVDVGGLVASTLNISDSDFLSSHYKLSGDGVAVVNRGTITAKDGGYIVLLGSQVSNEGFILAQQGTVALGAGKQATLDFYGDVCLPWRWTKERWMLWLKIAISFRRRRPGYHDGPNG